MMARTLRLTDKQNSKVKIAAAGHRQSAADYIREAIDRRLAAEKDEYPLLALALEYVK